MSHQKDLFSTVMDTVISHFNGYICVHFNVAVAAGIIQNVISVSFAFVSPPKFSFQANLGGGQSKETEN